MAPVLILVFAVSAAILLYTILGIIDEEDGIIDEEDDNDGTNRNNR